MMRLQNKMAPLTPRIPRKGRVATLQKMLKIKELTTLNPDLAMTIKDLQISQTKKPAKPSWNGRRKKGCTTTTLKQ